jgi:hypothetical protein
MDDLFIGTKVTVIFEETRSVERVGVLVSSDEEGVVVRYEYRKGTRLGWIPRGRLEEIHFDEEKPARKSRKKRAAKKATATVVSRQTPTPVVIVEDPVEEKEEVLTPKVEVAETPPTVEEEASADLADIYSEKEEFDDDDEDEEFDEDDDFD